MVTKSKYINLYTWKFLLFIFGLGTCGLIFSVVQYLASYMRKLKHYSLIFHHQGPYLLGGRTSYRKEIVKSWSREIRI